MSAEAELAPKECPGCRAEPDTPHEDDCDHAHCPGCGEQLLLHDCGDSDRPSIWHGIRPDEEAAITADMWFFHSAPDIRRYVPDCARARMQLDWDASDQRFRV